ncbi:MAG: FAD-dependent oxidoreductase [bacterium]|nr:FAD-dependent oxidoreductase [bacterium]
MNIDAGIIGGGVVGLATALALKERFPGAKIVVFEKNGEPFSEASRFNSGVVHSGIHQEPTFLKSRLAREGGPMLIAFCEAHNVPFRKTGMLIAVAAEDMMGLVGETKSLWHLYKNSRRQKIALEFLHHGEIEELEPYLHASFGLYMPDIWVVDQPALGRAMVLEAERVGIGILCNAEVTAIDRSGDAYHVVSSYGVHAARLVVNAAGVHADSVAAMAGFSGYTIHPYRGEYYEVIGEKRNLIRNTLVYPALRPGSPFKGIHITKTIDGRMFLGPNASPWKERSDDFTVRTPPEVFLAAAKKFLPSLELKDLRWLHAGLRAKINPGLGEDDFVIKCEAKRSSFVNLVGIESPGFTSSFAIARYVMQMAQEERLF